MRLEKSKNDDPDTMPLKLFGVIAISMFVALLTFILWWPTSFGRDFACYWITRTC